MARQGALPKVLALLLVPGILATARSSADVRSGQLSPGSALQQAVWLQNAAAQAASINHVQLSAAALPAAGQASSTAKAPTDVLPSSAAKAVFKRHHPLQHHLSHVRLLPSGSLLRFAADEGAVAAAVAPLVQAAAGAVHKQSQPSSSNTAIGVPSSRVLAACAQQQGSSTTASSPGSSSSSDTDCGTITANDGPPHGLSPSAQAPSSGSNSGTQAPSPTQQSAAPGSSSSSSSSNLPAQQQSQLQAGDVFVRGGSDGSWHCIRRPGCKPSALAFGAAYLPFMAAGECQLMGGCEAVQKQGACNAPFSWEVDRRAAAVVQYCGEQCKCPGEN